MNKEVLRMENITKIYSNGFTANRDVNLVVHEGEILALVGENGAGKTTLMKILFGMEDHQGGHIEVNGETVKINSPLDAIALGIGMVHQHFMQVPSATVAENVTLGIEPHQGVIYDRKKAVEITQELSDRYQLKVKATDRIMDLSVAQRQKVEILKALARNCRILILDEPTAVLTPQETEELFIQLKALKESGISIIFISHKLNEVMQLSDNIVVLRAGRVTGTVATKDVTPAVISRLMVGRDVILSIKKEDPKPEDTILQVRNLVFYNDENVKVVDNVSFGIRKGEIVGIAGVEGNGQNEIAELVTGLLKADEGEVFINGTSTAGKDIGEIRALGLAYISEDRLRYGCAPGLSIRENIMADRLERKEFRSGLLYNNKKITKHVDDLIKEFEIACDDQSQPVRMLSGGNIQKVVVAREFSSGANIIVANQPTRGIDVGTSELIRKTLVRKSRDKEASTLLVSSDLNEILEVSDRLLVMKNGRIVAQFHKANEVNEYELGEYMLGIKSMTPEEMGDLL
ncbi:MAG: ABC transporter ATP-binding protein [Erysipelotrichaceae bacterium]|nr:ABC transporter ATP-binding protein [Erysipelotrichaceae bacterium]